MYTPPRRSPLLVLIGDIGLRWRFSCIEHIVLVVKVCEEGGDGMYDRAVVGLGATRIVHKYYSFFMIDGAVNSSVQ